MVARAEIKAVPRVVVTLAMDAVEPEAVREAAKVEGMADVKEDYCRPLVLLTILLNGFASNSALKERQRIFRQPDQHLGLQSQLPHYHLQIDLRTLQQTLPQTLPQVSQLGFPQNIQLSTQHRCHQMLQAHSIRSHRVILLPLMRPVLLPLTAHREHLFLVPTRHRSVLLHLSIQVSCQARIHPMSLLYHQVMRQVLFLL